jgi:hypothetical protein
MMFEFNNLWEFLEKQSSLEKQPSSDIGLDGLSFKFMQTNHNTTKRL